MKKKSTKKKSTTKKKSPSKKRTVKTKISNCGCSVSSYSADSDGDL